MNYLLQRLEHYSGVVVMTTNKEASLDEALQRRLTLHLHLQIPEPPERERLWRSMLPTKAPSARNINFRALANDYEISGGYIKNVALRLPSWPRRRASRSTWVSLRRAAALESWKTWAAWSRAAVAKMSPACPMPPPVPSPSRARQRLQRIANHPFAFSARFSLATTPVKTWQHPPLHLGAIGVPVRAVATGAVLIVAALAMDQQDRKVDEIEVRQYVAELARQAPGQTHHQIAGEVEVPRDAPKARGEELRAARRANERRASSPDLAAGIEPKAMLLEVGAAEQEVAAGVERNDGDGGGKRQVVSVRDQILRLQREGKRHPDQAAPRQHEAEALVPDVPDGVLVQEVVGDVEN